jgi:predicted aspartyl protease
VPDGRLTSFRAALLPGRIAAAFAAGALVLCGGPVCAKRSAAAVPVTTILAAYERATHADDVTTYVADGTLIGEGLSGTFHVVRDGTNEREDDDMGPRHETTLRLGDRMFVRNANGNVRELRGYLYRRALTEDFLASGAFATHPEFSRFAGWGEVNGVRAWRLEVRATGGEPETLWLDAANGLPLRLEYLDGDGPSFVEYGDWRNVAGREIPFRAVLTDGDRRFDTVQQTTAVQIDQPVDAAAFRPLTPRLLATDRVHTVPLVERDGHVGITVQCAGRDWLFLLDTGSQSILADSAVLKAAGVEAEGALEVRGATRSGGLGVTTLPSLSIDGVPMDDVVVSSLDLGGSMGGRVRIDGILGYPFFASALVEMDFAHHVLRFGPPGSFVPAGTRVALDVDRELAEAPMRANDVVAPFIVDTGNSADLLLYRPFVDAHPGLVPTSTHNALNYGIGGSNAAYRSTLDVLEIGGVALHNRPVDVVLAREGAFADRVDAGNVGLGVLKNFVVTFDLGQAAMYLTPGAEFDDGQLSTVLHAVTSE